MKNNKKNYLSNIKTNYLFTFFKRISITQGVWMLYLASIGFNLYQIGLIEGIFHLTSFTMEIPTGAIADIYGKKTSRLLSLILMILSAFIMLTQTNFTMIAVAFVISALSYNLESGANEALVYDSLVYHKQEDSYMGINGKVQVVEYFSSAIALVLGGYVAIFGYLNVYRFEILLGIICLLIGIKFIEPKLSEKQPHETIHFVQAIKQQFTDCIKTVKGNHRLTYLILLSSMESVSITLSFYYLQILFQQNQYNTFQIGIILALSSISGIIGAYYAERIEKKFGQQLLLRLLPFLMSICIVGFAMTNQMIVTINFFMLTIFEAIAYVTMSDYINKQIDSSVRATVLSFSSTVFSLLMILLFPIFGFIADLISIPLAFLIFGFVMLALSIINLRYQKKTLSA